MNTSSMCTMTHLSRRENNCYKKKIYKKDAKYSGLDSQLSDSRLLLSRAWEAAVMAAQVAGFLPPTGEAWIEFLVPGLACP